ncbi:beta-1,6-N-acetylglucosaminyltransferase [Escherichia coli]|uniref:beta-1,6-N-acetylglucosaminyltransferase n=1 Tax=Escherichia coli TaxID=562 RepID=UPI001CED8C60|nr:beta-1,6-N-acetylglucosaminyltransferase [Escherichia coli]
METAVLIQTHNNAKYISTLAKRNPSVRFYVHVDNKTPLTYKEIEKNNISNLYLIKNRVDVYWGGSSQLIATLRLMMEAIKDSNNKYFHLISGECLPLKSFADIEAEWKLTPDTNYIESHRDPTYDWRLKALYFHTDTKYLRTPLGRVITKILKFSTIFFTTSKIDKNYYFVGSQWFSVTRSTINKFISIYTSTSFFSHFKYTTCADEHAFQILVRMYGIDNIADNNKRLIMFTDKSSPIYLSEKILQKNIEASNFWFARKVNEDLAISFLL